MDFVEEINREFTEHMQNVGKPGYEYDGCYSRIMLTREVFIRMCQALQVASGIVQKLKKLPEHAQEKIGYMIEGAALVTSDRDGDKKDGGAA